MTISAITGNYEVMKLLLDAGGEVNKPNGLNQTPIVCCFARLEEVSLIIYRRRIIYLRIIRYV